MTTSSETDKNQDIMDLLLKTLRGGYYNLDHVKDQLSADKDFEEIGIDSLDMTTFFIEIEDKYKVDLPVDGSASLNTITAIRKFIEEHAPTPASQ